MPNSQVNCEPLKALIRTVPDFPKPGILFYDITTVLKDKAGFAQLIDAFAAYYIGKDIDLVLGIEARGFIFGPALAYHSGRIASLPPEPSAPPCLVDACP